MSHMEQVKASAGSGKTHDITQRFLAFLAQSPLQPYAPQCVLRPSSSSSSSVFSSANAVNSARPGAWGDIMAITFTNMAASEMKSRVLESLKKCALAKSPDPIMSAQQAKAWIEIILRQYGALNIRTIDSLLHLIVRTAALDLGLPPDFASSFHVKDLMEPMFEDVLSEADKGDAVSLEQVRAMCRSLVYHKDMQGFVMGQRLVQMLLPLVEYFLSEEAAPMQALSPAEELEARLVELETACITKAKHLCSQIQAEQLKVDKRAMDCFMGSAAGERKRLTSAYYTKEDFDACLLKAGKGTASDAVCFAYASLKESIQALATEGEVLRKALYMYPFVEVAQNLAQKMLDFQLAESTVPAAKIPTLAREILEGQHGISAALCRMGSAMQHVLVDEFQDTSTEQWQAMRLLIHEALAQGGSLTWVGDVKQAIYGWRGGDADLFDAVQYDDDLAPLASFGKKTLPINWRSREVVVQSNNALFAPLGQQEIARTVLEAMLNKDCPPAVLDMATQKLCRAFDGATQEVKPDAAGGYVCFEEVQAQRSDELSEEVRLRLQQKLQDLGQRRPWGDITILTRSNSGAATVAAWLLDWEIPAVTENSLLLQNHPLIKESLAFLSFLHAPQDDVSFWTVLTGHMMRPALRPASCASSMEGGQEAQEGYVGNIRPSLEELHTWILELKHEARPVSLSYAFQKKWPEFWEYTFAPFYGAAQMRTPYDCMQEWYGLWQVPQRFTEAEAFVRRFLEVLHSAERRGAGTLGTFLEYWAQSGGEEKTPTPPKVDAVRIMTIHKSKGLQFPVVIIPWLSFTMRPSSPPMVQKVGDFTVLATRTKLTEGQESADYGSDAQGDGMGVELGTAHYAAQAQDVLECLNVFYVACTRAQEELYAFHTHTPYLLGTVNLAKGINALLGAIGMELPFEAGFPIEKELTALPRHAAPPHEGEEGDAGEVNEIAEEGGSAQCDDTTPCPLDFSEEPQAIMQWLPRLKIYRDPLQKCFLTEPSADVGSHILSPVQRGLLMHHCLEVWQSMGGKEDMQATAKAAALWGVQSFALPLVTLPKLQEEVSAALLWYASLPGVQEWASHASPEQGILAEDGALYRADLVLAPQHGHGWRVVEFKTGQAQEAHVKQLAHYLHMLNTMPKRDAALPLSEGVLIYLDLQKCRMVRENAQGEMSTSSLLDAPQWHISPTSTTSHKA